MGEGGSLRGAARVQPWGAAVPVWGGSDKSNLAGVEGSSCRGEEDKRKARVGAWPAASAAFRPHSGVPGGGQGRREAALCSLSPGGGLASGQRGLLSA